VFELNGVGKTENELSGERFLINPEDVFNN